MCQVLLLACGVLAPGWSAGFAADEPADAGKNLQGMWVAVMAERDGKAAEDVIGHRLSFKGLRFEITSKTGKLRYQGTVSLQPDRRPPAIDFKHDGGDLKGKVWKGIYALDDKTLKICDNGPDPAKDRPTGFSAKEGSGHIVIVFKRKTKFTISKETTFVLGPVDKDGYIDYAAVLNERLRQGVTPENNANVLLWQAFGPKPEGKLVSPEFFRLLGMEPPPERGEYFVEFDRYMKNKIKTETIQEFFDQVEDQMSQTGQRPWTRDEFPHVAGWLEANAKPLAIALEATKRPEYFSPLVPANKDAESSGILAAPLPTLQRCRQLAKALTIRAMLLSGEERYEEAWQDLLACHRLGRLRSRGATLVEVLSAMANEAVATDAILAFLECASFDAKRLKSSLHQLQAPPSFSDVVEKCNTSERMSLLDVVQLIDRKGLDYLKDLELAAGIAAAVSFQPAIKVSNELTSDALGALDWDSVLRQMNQHYDHWVAAAREKDRKLRKKGFREIENELTAVKERLQDPEQRRRSVNVRNKFLAEVLLTLLATPVAKVQEAAERTEQNLRNLQIAFSLAAYHRDHGRYPAKLEMLAPAYLPRVPEDIFSGKALIYRPADNGYILYSVGINERDDGGRGYHDDPRGDDLVVRMPLPKLR